MKVKATGEFKKKNVWPQELGRIPEEGEIFEVTNERYNVLKGNNDFKTIFVTKLEEKIETAMKKEKTEKAIKKVEEVIKTKTRKSKK